jgi:UDP-N-acetyl-D-galactosamine dehydrogenase
MKNDIAVVGLGYVGLPLALAFAKEGKKILGFDVNAEKIKELQKGHDRTHEVDPADLQNSNITYTTDATALKTVPFIIVAVPTPITLNNEPDLSLVESASHLIGKNLSKGAIVVFESTVYPGVTEDVCAPIIEEESGMKYGKDWFIGYSPERINPGDKEHTLDKIVKVVAGMTPAITEKVAETYLTVCKAGVHKAESIKVAEAAKVIENIQRDLNIALMNELSLIFKKLDIRTDDVLRAAGTKWNFHRYTPGLVGGHCIGVDPYYLVYRARELGIHPQVITAGRSINDGMAPYLAAQITELLQLQGKDPKKGKALVLGVTFKENVPDIRNSKVFDLIKGLQKAGVHTSAYDPIASHAELAHEYQFTTMLEKPTGTYDVVILAAPHHEFKEWSATHFKKLLREGGILLDIKSALNPADFAEDSVSYMSL